MVCFNRSSDWKFSLLRVGLNWVSLVSKWVSMEISLKLANVGFFLLFLTWVLVEFWKQRREGGDEQLKHGAKVRRRPTNLVKITILSNAIISTLYVGFCCYEFWKSRTIYFVSAFSALT